LAVCYLADYYIDHKNPAYPHHLRDKLVEVGVVVALALVRLEPELVVVVALDRLDMALEVLVVVQVLVPEQVLVLVLALVPRR